MNSEHLDALIQAIEDYITNKKAYSSNEGALLALKKTFKSHNITIEDWNNLVEIVNNLDDLENISIEQILEDLKVVLEEFETKEDAITKYNDLLTRITSKASISNTIFTTNTLPSTSDYSVGQIIHVFVDAITSNLDKFYVLTETNSVKSWKEIHDFNKDVANMSISSLTRTEASIVYTYVGFDQGGAPIFSKTFSVPKATTTQAGLMSATDKHTLDVVPETYATKGEVVGKENTSNKKYTVTDETATDTYYLSAKAVRDFVNGSISTNTANYISNEGEPFASLAQLQAYSGTVTNNDYAFITGTDTSGNIYYDRYKATVTGTTVSWGKEFRLNNSSFTVAQWNAITSGITSALVTKLTNINITNIENGTGIGSVQQKLIYNNYDISPIASGKGATAFGGKRIDDIDDGEDPDDLPTTKATGILSFAAGAANTASGKFATVFGKANTVSGRSGFSAGEGNTVSGQNGSVFGATNSNAGTNSMTIGASNTITSGVSNAFAGGGSNTVSANYSFAFGFENEVSATYSTAFGLNNEVSASHSFAEGANNVVDKGTSHAEGQGNQAGSEIEDNVNRNTSSGSESGTGGGEGTTIIPNPPTPTDPDDPGSSEDPGTGSGTEIPVIETEEVSCCHAEGTGTNACGLASHSEGYYTQAKGGASHSEGLRTLASGENAHSEGTRTIASGVTSHAEGHSTTASGAISHAEGGATTASGTYSHAEGYQTVASGYYSHAEGNDAKATGNVSHASGEHTTASHNYQFVLGQFNKDLDSTLFEVGNGSGLNIKNNAFAVYRDGHAEIDVMGSTTKSVATKGYVDNLVDSLAGPASPAESESDSYTVKVGTDDTITSAKFIENCEAGVYDSTYVGSIAIIYKDNVQLFRIILIGVNHDILSKDGSTKAKTTWQYYDMPIKECYLGLPFNIIDWGEQQGKAYANAYLDGTNTSTLTWYPSNRSGYPSATGLINSLHVVYESMPIFLRNAIKMVRKRITIPRSTRSITANGETESDTATSTYIDEMLFHLSLMELGRSSLAYEGTRYALFGTSSSDANRVRYYNGVAKDYWLRTPYTPNSNIWISMGDTLNSRYTNTTYGVAPAFCI